ncbi:MAG: Holliday junction resolvase RuvX [Acidimicrobiia bacterium]|nr:Holliday junction resolvase RuvX [Acidimicrobiia bacterium]
MTLSMRPAGPPASELVVRVLGIDLGTKRIGLALSDSSATVASPLTVVVREGDRESQHRVLREIVTEYEAELVVVGLPLSLDGTIGPAAQRALDEIDKLRATIGVPVEPYDERLTTVTADRALGSAGVRGSKRRAVIDKVAAAVMLQAWLDSRAVARDLEETE